MTTARAAAVAVAPASGRPADGGGGGGTAALLALLALIYLLPLRDVVLVNEEPTVRPFDAAALLVLAAGGWLVLGSPRHALPAAPVLAFCVFYAQLCMSALLGARHGGDGALIARTLVWPLYCFGVFAAGAILARRHEPGFVLRHLAWSLVAANAAAYALFVLAPDLVGRWAGGIDLSAFGVDLWRFPGFASEPNYWGSMHLFVLPLACLGLLSAAVRARSGLGPVPLAALLLAAAATFSTFTHAALLASLLGALLLGGWVRRPLLKLGALGLAAVAAIGFVLASGYGEHVVDKLSRLDDLSSAGERVHAATAAARMWAEAPVLGHGLGTYAAYHNDFADVPLRPIESAFSVLMATLAEQGVVGLATLMALFAALMGLGVGAVQRTVGRDAVLRMLLLGLLLYGGYLTITGNLYLYYFWFYCGLFHGLARGAVAAAGPRAGACGRATTAPPPAPPRLPAGGGLTASAAPATYGAAPFPPEGAPRRRGP